jgi:outer membrane lipoprotein carrier protein
MMMRAKSFLLAACLLGSVAMANPAQQAFEQFVQTVPAAKGLFTQYTVGPEGQTSLAQSGDFSFARPGQFRWDIREPYAQLVLSDGLNVYQYDPDLSQVSVRSAAAAMGGSPAAILFGTGDINQAFVVSPLPDSDGLSWFRAVPRQPDSGLSQLDIGMQAGNPARLLLLDGFGQTTRIDLSGIRAQASFPKNTFRFQAPPNTDIVKVD